MIKTFDPILLTPRKPSLTCAFFETVLEFKKVAGFFAKLTL